MAEYKESKDNPLHKEFGVWSNSCYIVKKMAEYCPIVIVISIVGMICNSVSSYFWGILGKFIIDIIEKSAAGESAVESELVKLILVAGTLAIILGIGRCIYYNRSWFNFINVRMHMITERVRSVLELRYEMLERPDVLDIAERAAQATGGNVNGVEGMMRLIPKLAERMVTVIVTFVAIAVLDWCLIVVFIVLEVITFLHYKYTNKHDKAEVWDMLSPTWRQRSYMERVTQDFDYAKEIRLFDLSDFLTKKQREIFEVREKLMDHHQDLWFRHILVSNLLFIITKVVAYGALFHSVINKGLSIGDFTMYLAFAMAFGQALSQLLQRFGDYTRNSAETDDFRSFVEMVIEDDEKDTVPIPKADEYEIEFHNVSYRYSESKKNALSNLSLKLKAGERLAVVGLNGAGKTTMIKLLIRLYDPTEGKITLNGVDIRNYKRRDYYKLFAPVFQNVEVFAFPISKNVSMKSDENTDRAIVEHSLKEAGLWEKIESLTKGIDTALTNIVEDDGIELSGGEKQKLALARAIYKGANIVILDEPTSALDAIAEQQLYEKFDEMIGQKSSVYISHRLASTQFCDRIAMFADGEMVELGSHKELMEKGGAYADMFNTQAQYYRQEKEQAEAFEEVTEIA